MLLSDRNDESHIYVKYYRDHKFSHCTVLRIDVPVITAFKMHVDVHVGLK